MTTSMQEAPVVIVGSREDAHVVAVARRVAELGAEPVVLDSAAFPERTQVELGERLEDIRVDGRALGRPGAVYLRQTHAGPLSAGAEVQEAMAEDWRATIIALREKADTLQGVLGRWEALGVPLYNPRVSDWRTVKPVQLSLLQQAGLPVPDSLWTNSPEAVRRFAAGRRIAYKPVSGGAATRELSPEDLTDERLTALSAAPVTFQELLPGEDVRVYVLDGELIASLRITSRALDFRQNEEAIEQVALSPEVARQCLQAAKVLGLRWTGMDLKRASDGRLKFLELNTSPMFLGFDANGGTDILGHLAGALVRAARRPVASAA